MSGLIKKSSYRILENIHKSGRFELSKAQSLEGGQELVIKELAKADNELKNSLKSEAQAGLKLRHPAIRRSMGYHEDGVKLYMVSQYLEGISLGHYLLGKPQGVDFDQGLLWARTLAEVLDFAAAQGVSHLNLNPYNIIVSPDEKLSVIGFGKNRKAWRHSEGNIRFALPLLYTPPEEFHGALIHDNSDLFSWAVIVYQIFTGHLPWRTDTFISPEEQKEQSLTRAVLQPKSEQLPSWLFSLILDCLKISALARPKSAALLSEALRREGNYVDYDELEEYIQKQQIEKSEKELTEPPESGLEEAADLPQAPAPAKQPESSEVKPDLSAADKQVFEQTEPETDESAPAQAIQSPADSEPEPAQIAEPTPRSQPAEPTQEKVAAQPPKEELTELSKTETMPAADVESPKEPAEPQKPELKDRPKSIATTAAATKSPEKIVFPPQESQKEDLSYMQKTFRILLFISLVIILFLVGRYYLGRQNKAGGLPETLLTKEPESTEPQLLKENIPLDMIRVKADTLYMGSIDPDAADDEFPLLSIPMQSYLISAKEISQKEWLMVYDTNPSIYKGENRPVENVSFYDVIEYCNAKSEKDGLTPAYNIHGNEIICDFEVDGYRLPTEAEWEFAAKAGKKESEYIYSGGEVADDVAWYYENSRGGTNEIGLKEPNTLGIYDMSGNVYEWVWNWYGPYSYRTQSLFSGPNSGTDKVLRGGSWYHSEDALRVSKRAYMKPFLKNSYTGFRVVRSR